MTERRRFKRVKTNCKVRFLVNRMEEVDGQACQLSAGAIHIASRQMQVRPGDHIIAYIQGVERFEGYAMAVRDKRFSMSVCLSPARRERLMETLTAELACADGLLDRMDPKLDRRNAKRRAAYNKTSTCTLPDGTSIICSVIDVSLSGLAIAIPPVLRLGEIVRVGRSLARVVRELEDGYGLEFVQAQVDDRISRIFEELRHKVPHPQEGLEASA